MNNGDEQLILDLWELAKGAVGAAQCERSYYEWLLEERARLKPLVTARLAKTDGKT